MKKFLIMFVILGAIPAFGACPIDAENTSCSLANYQEANSLDSPSSTSNPFVSTPNAIREPMKGEAISKPLRGFGQQETDYSYNSSCQFGVCNQTGAPRLFPNKSR
jgi:hypothetical protein